MVNKHTFPLGIGLLVGVSVAYFQQEPPQDRDAASRDHSYSNVSTHSGVEAVPAVGEVVPAKVSEAVPLSPDRGIAAVDRGDAALRGPAVEPPPLRLVDQGALASWRSAGLYEAYFKEEPFDHIWAPDMQSRIFDRVGSWNASVHALQADCRTTICRIEISYGVSKEDVESEEEPYTQQFIDEVAMPIVTEDGARVDRYAVGVVGRALDNRAVVLVAYFYDRMKEPPRPEISPQLRERALRALQEQEQQERQLREQAQGRDLAIR